jgi:oligopeptide transport system substrate-binding protein
MGDQLDVSPQLATYYYEFNTTRPPFNDPRAAALNMALDKDIIAEKVLGQGQRPAWLISQPDIGGVKLQNPDYASWPREKRIAEAKKLLSEAGMDSHPLVFNLLYNTSNRTSAAIAASSMWKKNSAWRRSCKTRSGRRCSIPCTRTILTRCAMRGLPTMTMPPLS